jgi:hypothetical protein
MMTLGTDTLHNSVSNGLIGEFYWKSSALSCFNVCHSILLSGLILAALAETITSNPQLKGVSIETSTHAFNLFFTDRGSQFANLVTIVYNLIERLDAILPTVSKLLSSKRGYPHHCTQALRWITALKLDAGKFLNHLLLQAFFYNKLAELNLYFDSNPTKRSDFVIKLDLLLGLDIKERQSYLSYFSN